MDKLLALRTFVRIAEAGSFIKAADQLDMPRSTATKLIQDLEQMLGVRLIQRTTRRTSVTPEGAIYYERAQRLLAEADEMDADIRDTRASPRGRLRVDIWSSLANLALIPALPSFQEQFPDIELQLGINDRPADLVGDGIDCVIRAGNPPDSSLVARKLCELEFVTCAHRSYVQRHRLPAHPRELQEGGHQLITYCQSHTGRPVSLQFERDGEVVEIQPRSSISVNESTAHFTALVTGLGIARNFRYQVQPYLDRGELVQVFPGWSEPRKALYIMYPQNRHVNARIRVFIDWAVQAFNAIDARADSAAAA